MARMTAPSYCTQSSLRRRVCHIHVVVGRWVFLTRTSPVRTVQAGCRRCQLLFTYVPIEAFVADWMAPAMSLTKVILPIRRPTLTRYQPT